MQDNSIRSLEREALEGGEVERLRYFSALHRSGGRVPLAIRKKQIVGSRLDRHVKFILEAASVPPARVPVELVILMNIGDKYEPVESFTEWRGKFTFKFTDEEGSDETEAKLRLARMSDPRAPKIEGCRIFNVWAGEEIGLTWHKWEDGLPQNVPWLFNVDVFFDPSRAFSR